MPQRPRAIIGNLIRTCLTEKESKASDSRSHRFVVVIDCVLNQNVRDTGAARFPAMNFELLQMCHRHGLGILQIPCPEMAVLGPGRERLPGQSLRAALDSGDGRCKCRTLAVEVADRIVACLAQGSELVAILGGNPRSPGCAVHEGSDGLRDESGVFMKALQAELRERGLEALFKGIRDHDPELLREDLAWFQERLGPFRK
jgi:predicted secreted protein